MRIGTLCITAVLVATCLASQPQATALAQAQPHRQVVADDFPLRPADTSSPRDTLRSFLSEMSLAVAGYFSGELNVPAYRRALQTLDFSTTPNGNTWRERLRRTILLKELLDRFELPAFQDIPGDEEVADGDMTAWTVPDSRITIARVEDGPRAGEFLFSAETVEQLQRFYRHAAHLPYAPGATPGLYDAYYSSETTVDAQQRRIRSELRPVDVHSPLSTLDGFMLSVNRAYDLIMRAEADTELTRSELLAIEAEAGNHLRAAALTLDLSEVPEALREDASVEAVVQLKEVLDRMLLVPLDGVPDRQMVEAARREHGLEQWQSIEPLRWRHPSSDIEIVEIIEGDREGQFLFSAATVARIHESYERVRHLPYRPSSFDGTELDYMAPDISPGFYEYYISTPGYLVPRAYVLGSLVHNLPDWLKTLYAGQTLWQWGALGIVILLVAVTAYIIVRVFRRWARRVKPPVDGWLMIVPAILLATIVTVADRFVDQEINITGAPLAMVAGGATVIVLAMAAWAVYALAKAVAETVIASPRVKDETIDAALLRIGARIVGFLIAVYIVIRGVRDLGADILPLLAGLGVGGLAVALAAQRTFANFIGSLILFANKPVRVGDFCRYGDEVGTVESIGLISTRIRSLERTIVTVPNAEFSEMKLDNFTARDLRLLKTVLQLRYETTPEQMRYVLARLRELLLGHPMVTPEPARVRFWDFGAHSKDLEIFAYLRCRDQDVFCAIKEDILLRIDDIITEAGTGFAFPSQTAYLARDPGLDTARSEQAAQRVEEWRMKGKLPFPEFEEEERERLQDIIDYPPKGSPDS